MEGGLGWWGGMGNELGELCKRGKENETGWMVLVEKGDGWEEEGGMSGGGGGSERREHRRERIRAQGIHVALEVQRTRVERGRCFLVGGPSRRERQVRSGGEGGYRERPQGYKASLIIFCRPHDRGARLPGMTEIEWMSTYRARDREANVIVYIGWFRMNIEHIIPPLERPSVCLYLLSFG